MAKRIGRSEAGGTVVDYLLLTALVAAVAVPVFQKYAGAPLRRTLQGNRQTLVQFIGQSRKQTVPHQWFEVERVPDPSSTTGGSTSGSSSNSGNGNGGNGGNSSGGASSGNNGGSGGNNTGPSPWKAFHEGGNNGNPLAGGNNGQPPKPNGAAPPPANPNPPLANFDERNWRRPPVSEPPPDELPRSQNPRARSAADGGSDLEPRQAGIGGEGARKAPDSKAAAPEARKKRGELDPRRGDAGGAAAEAANDGGAGGAVSWRFLLRWLILLLILLLLLYLIFGELKRRRG